MEGLIKFDSPRSVFYSGQVISGNFQVEVESPVTYSVIYIKYLGEANVKWTEEESEEINGHKRYKNVEYVGREEYFKGSQLLAGSYGSVDNLNPGTHTYKFQFKLPGGVPSSYKGKRGQVTYLISGHVEFQTQSLFKKTLVKEFDVVVPFDLNKGNSCVKDPISIEFEEVYSCGCFCSTKPVSVVAGLPVSAYCPGQAVPVHVAVRNEASVEIRNIILELITRERYRTQTPVSEYTSPEEVLTSVKTGSIMSGTNRNLSRELVIPDLIAPNLEDCSIIEVGFFFRVTVKLSGCNEDLQDEAEICLGLIPLQETVEGVYTHPMAHSLPLDPVPIEQSRISVSNIFQDMSGLGTNSRPNSCGFIVPPPFPPNVTDVNPPKSFQIGFVVSPSDVPPAYNPAIVDTSPYNQVYGPSIQPLSPFGQNPNVPVANDRAITPSAPPM